jgi:DNA-binding beta-propeller fold protein YncE
MKQVFFLIFLLLLCAVVQTVSAGETYVYSGQWGTYGSTDGQFNRPVGITVDSAGNVLVADEGNNRVEKFTSNGSFLAKWGSSGSEQGQFSYPWGVVEDSDGNIYVADSFNHRVQKFTSTGTFVMMWGTYGSGNGQFNYPNGLAVDSEDNVYVTEYHGNRVQKFTSNGIFITKWGRNGGDGSSGSGDGQFNIPMGIAVDSTGYVYVADINNNRVQKFTSNGTFVAKWGKNGGDGLSGSGDGEFYHPWGIAVDNKGNVYVVDTGNYRIQKFTSNGTFVAKWGKNGGDGSWGSENGEFDQPQGIAVDSSGIVYVSEWGGNRVQKFSKQTVTPTIVPGGAAVPRDLNGDGTYEDVNGNGEVDFNDVVLFFNQMDWIAVSEPVEGFDFNGDGQIDFNDIVTLFNEL